MAFKTPTAKKSASNIFTAQVDNLAAAKASTAAPENQASGEAASTAKASTNKKDLAEALQRLHAAGQVDDFNKLAKQAGSVFTPEEVKAYGLDQFGKGETGKGESWLGRFQKNAGKVVSLGDTATGGGLSKVLSAVDRPRAVVAAGFKQAAIGLDDVLQNKDPRHMSWSAFKTDVNDHIGFGQAYADLQKAEAQASKDKGGSGSTSTFGIKSLGAHINNDGGLSYNSGAGHVLANAVGVGGDIAGDPLTYLGGESAISDAVKKAVAKDVGEETAKKIAVHGLEGGLQKGVISEAEHLAIQDTLRSMADDLVERAAEAGKAPGRFSLSRDVRAAGKAALAGDAESLSKRYLDVLSKQGREGLKWGPGELKRTIIPKYPFGEALPGVTKYGEAVLKGGTSGAASVVRDTKAVADQAPLPRPMADIQRAKAAVEAAPSATGAGGYGKVVEGQIPTTPGMHAVDDGFGGKIIGIRGDDGTLKGYLMATEDAVNTFENLSGEKGLGQALLKAGDDAGLDMPKLLANSDFTEEGRKAALRYLDGQLPGGTAISRPKIFDAGRPMQEGLDFTGAKEAAFQATPTEGFKAAEAAAGPFEPWRNARAEVVRPGVVQGLKESKVGQVLGDAFSPRSAVKRYSQNAADLLYRGQETASATLGQLTHDMAIQLGKSTEKAVKALDKLPEELVHLVPELEGMTGRDAWNTLSQAILEQRVEMGAVLKALPEDITNEVWPALKAYQDIAEKGGVVAGEAAPEGVLPGLVAPEQPQVARIFTGEAQKIAEGDKALQLREALGVGPDQTLRKGADLTAEAKKALPSGKSIRQLNEHLVDKLNLAPGTKIFEDDTLTAVALRSRASFEAATTTDMFEKLSKEMVDHETPMLSILDPTDKEGLALAKDRGWKELPGKQPTIGRIVGPPEVMDELSKVQAIITNDVSMNRLQKALDGWNATWASYATNPLPFGMGFHSRNAVGNVILAFMGGLSNPVKFAEAFGLQRDLASVRKLMSQKGIDFEEAIREAGLDAGKARLIKDMRQHGVISAGFFADLDNYDLSRLTHAGTSGEGLAAKVKHGLNDNVLIHTNRRIGDVVENNARMALYLDAFEKSGSVTAAADRVKKYLFDYGDLTAFEKKNMKSLNRFYTFTRKNVAVQLYTLAHDPWKIKAVLGAEQGVFGGDSSGPLPDYAKKAGFGVSSVFGRPKGTEGVAYNMDTPFDNAVKTLDPIAQAVTLVPGVRTLVPPQYRSSTQELTRSVLNLRSGGPQEFINFMFESATGKDTFSGKDISKESGSDTLGRLANAINPLWGKADRGIGGVRNPAGNQPGMTERLSLLQALTGLNLIPMTDKQRNQVAYVAAQEAQDALTKLKEQGVDVPTYTDLVRIGLAPDLKSPAPAQQKRSAEQVTADTIDKVNKARQAAGQPGLSIIPPAPKASASKPAKFKLR